MVSGFQCQCHGFFNGLINDKVVSSYQLFEAGINRDGWFTNEDLVNQIKELGPLIKKIHPDCDIVIAFDNSMTHHKKAPNGLDVPSTLPLKDNGKNAPLMRDTTFIHAVTNEEMIQTMTTAQKGQKGIRYRSTI